MVTATDALQRLRDGNARFQAGELSGDLLAGPARRAEQASPRQPFAIIVGSADAPVSAEMVFDQGLGDLFAVRVSGDRLAPAQLDGVEHAAEQLGARLVVVLGHANGSALQATLEQLQQDSAILERLANEKGLRIIGARFSLDSGEVVFIEET